MQAIEILPVARSDRAILYLKPEHAESFVIGWPARSESDVIVRDALARLGLQARVVHSTSWRHQNGEVVLTYLAVVAGVPDQFVDRAVAVRRTGLARGDTTAPPSSIAVGQVLEHALRHLAWLAKDDGAIAHELPDWSAALAGYVPEPFRQLGMPG
jgi:hypothetical protein